MLPTVEGTTKWGMPAYTLGGKIVLMTAAFKAQYAQRAGVEGTHSQAIRRCGLRRSRYIGLAKTHLQHLLTAVALNVIRLGEWWLGTPRAKTRCSPFAALRVTAA